MAKKEFKFKELDTTKLPKTVGKKVDGFRFYDIDGKAYPCLLYTSPSPRDGLLSRMPSSA